MLSTRRFLSAVAMALAGFVAAAGQSWVDVSTGYAPEALVKMLPPDGFRSLDAPRFLPVAEAAPLLPFLDDGDLLISVERLGERRLYPIKALIWHEIVNDRFGPEGVCVSYCILTGSPVAFLSSAVAQDGSLTPHTYGVSGYLYQSNLVMYDRQTGSTWPQLAFRCVSGREKGKFLSPLPYGLVTWKRAREELSSVPVLCGDGRNWMPDPMAYAGRPVPALEGYENSPVLRAPVSPAAVAASGERAKALVLHRPYGPPSGLEPYAGPAGEMGQPPEPAILMYEFAWRAFKAAGLLP